MGKILKLLRDFKLKLSKGAYNLLNTSKFEDRFRKNLLFIKESSGKKSANFYKAHEKLFTGDSSSSGNLNTHTNQYISKIKPLKELSEKAANYGTAKGICNPLCSFIVFAKLENQKDFDEIMALLPKTEEQREFYNQLSELADKQAFIDLFENNQTDSWKQDTLLFLTMMTENFSIFNTQPDSKDNPLREHFAEDRLFSLECNHHKKRPIKFGKHLKNHLEKVGSDSYLQFNIGVTDGGGHALLIYKAADDKYLFFDPNDGATGFDKEGNPNLTLKQLAKVIDTTVNAYTNDIASKMPKNPLVSVSCYNATEVLDKSIEFYREHNKDTPDSKLLGLKIENAISDEKVTRL